jgi:hypothetical protein
MRSRTALWLAILPVLAGCEVGVGYLGSYWIGGDSAGTTTATSGTTTGTGGAAATTSSGVGGSDGGTMAGSGGSGSDGGATTGSGGSDGGCALATPPSIAWHVQAARGAAWSIATDPQGNALVAGLIVDSIDFGLGALPPAMGSAGGFVVKLAADAGPLWNVDFAGSGSEALAVAADGEGNAIVMGDFSSALQVGTGSLTGLDDDMFVVKLGASGAYAWGASFGVAGTVQGVGVAVDSAANAIATGTFTDTVRVGAMMLDQGGTFVAKLDPQGNARWATRLAPTSRRREPPWITTGTSS